MIDFLVKYWRLILEVILLIASVVVLVLKKKPVKIIEGLTEAITRLLPVFMNIAEKTDLKGDDKKQYVLLRIREALISLGYEACDSKYVDSLTCELLEAFLSTPQKKEVKHED